MSRLKEDMMLQVWIARCGFGRPSIGWTLAALVASRLCFHCPKATPLRVNTILNEGQLFCLDSMVPYLKVIFSFTNILSVCYSVKDYQRTHGSFTVPGRIVGIDFSEALGTLENELLLGGALNFTCSRSRRSVAGSAT
jgi:hypothetical protein